mmetsp:Transcript_12556/g.46413  ORF Transcript_12556/g.46413 Transcript_12556/m.46413 type:complete len:255 (-) Transcript_12556:170-934(-)
MRTCMRSDFMSASGGGRTPISIMMCLISRTDLLSSSRRRYFRLRPPMRSRRCSSKPASSVGSSKRHTGQVQCLCSQSLMHSVWKMWPQGSLVAISPSSWSSMQMQQLSLPSVSRSTWLTFTSGKLRSTLRDAGGGPVRLGGACVACGKGLGGSAPVPGTKPKASAIAAAACCACMLWPAAPSKMPCRPSRPCWKTCGSSLALPPLVWPKACVCVRAWPRLFVCAKPRGSRCAARGRGSAAGASLAPKGKGKRNA